MLVECELSKLIINEVRDHQIVTLRELEEPHREFPIVIGIFEAVAIHRKLQQVEMPRPLTHDLIASIIDEMDARLDRVVVSDLVDSTFFARLELDVEDRDDPVIVDSRPSDALAVAVRTGARVFVDERVFQKVSSEE